MKKNLYMAVTLLLNMYVTKEIVCVTYCSATLLDYNTMKPNTCELQNEVLNANQFPEYHLQYDVSVNETIYNDKNDLDERAAICLTLKKIIL